ncbi:MAG: hypothetical protein IKA03_02355 [Alphaproteobacteria bacterium]|nr:hypothetical protein [Alphaproteobacteria bacterium]
MSNIELETFDFLINDEDEAMLLLYVRESEPKSSSIHINFENKSAVLHRNDTDIVELSGIPDEVLDSLEEADKLLICELSIEKNDEDTKIVYAYEAEITN